MFADAPNLCPKKLMSSLFARPTQRQAMMPGQPCQGRLSTSSSSRCAVFEMWVFILAWTDMVAVGAGQPLRAAAKAWLPIGGGKAKVAWRRISSHVHASFEGSGSFSRAAVRARNRGACLLVCYWPLAHDSKTPPPPFSASSARLWLKKHKL